MSELNEEQYRLAQQLAENTIRAYQLAATAEVRQKLDELMADIGPQQVQLRETLRQRPLTEEEMTQLNNLNEATLYILEMLDYAGKQEE
ncbi:MAG: hypothetical protein GC178_01125 [Flavobacteriales bacterium]|nr:hypothetical protein [Flavobacteriales bacterium]